jgi:hypothetical protein
MTAAECSRNHIKRVLQNRLDALITARSSKQCPFRRAFHTSHGVLIGEPNDAQARSVAHLRVRLVGENAFKQPSGMWAYGLSPMHHPRRCPFQMRLVGTWTMLGNRDGMPVAVSA